MAQYAWMIGIILIAALLLRGYEADSSAFILIAAVSMFVIMGLRDATAIGVDSASSYLHMYQEITAQSWSELPRLLSGEYNIGFLYLMKLINVLSDGNYQTFIIVISAFIMLCFAHFVRRYSVSPLQSICYYLGLLLYSFMFSAEKQAIAMSIVLLAFDAIMDRRPVRFLLLVILAAQFHFPAYIFLPAYWFADIKISWNFLLYFMLLLLLTYIFREAILKLMLSAYGSEELNVSMQDTTFLRTKSIVMIAIVVASLLLKPDVEADSLYGVLFSFLVCAVVLQTFCGYNNIFERLADYYFQFSIIFIPLVFEREPTGIQGATIGSLAQVCLPFAVSAYGLYRFWYTVAVTPTLSPYSFYF